MAISNDYFRSFRLIKGITSVILTSRLVATAANVPVRKRRETLRIKLRDLLEKGEYKGIICRDFYSLSKPQLVKPLCLNVYATQLPIKVIIVSDVIIK